MSLRGYNPVLIERMLEDEPEQPSSRRITPTPNDSYSFETGILTVLMDIGDGVQIPIKFHARDDPIAVARKFVFQRNLDAKIIPILARNIRASITECDQPEAEPITHQRSNSKKRVNTSTSSVFERLYNQSFMKQVPEKEEKTNNKQNNSMIHNSLVNNGVMIYERNTRLTEENKKKIQKRIQQLRNQQQSELTFQPQINPISRLMVERMRELGQEETIQEKNSRAKKEKLIQLKAQKDRQEIEKCTFHPQTNRAHSKSMVSSHTHSRSTDRFEQLYNDSTYRALRKKNAQQVQGKSFQFQPSINKVSQIIVNGTSFDQRLRKYSRQKAKNEEQRKRQSEYRSVYESQTGNHLFRPQTGRAPSSRNRDGLPVGHYLYNSRFQKDKKIISLIRQEKKNSQPVRASEHSNRIYEESKITALISLFDRLDDDKDGKISSRKICIDSVEPIILQILSPLLNEMEQLDAQLDEQLFVQSVDRLLKVLPPTQRNRILKHHKSKPSQNDSMLFQPSFNEKSMELASVIRPMKSPGVSLYEFCQLKQAEKESFIIQEREYKQIELMSQCTFQPKVSRKRSNTVNYRSQR